VNLHAFSGGGNTLAEHREKGANLEVDVPYQYLTYFLEDDERLAQIRAEYGSGKMLTGEIKKELADVLIELTGRHQIARRNVTEDIVDAFMTPRPLFFKNF